MDNSLICRACLVTDVKMYNMQTFSVFTAYFDLTGISDIGVYSSICYECVYRLRKCQEFRSNCFKAHETLNQMITIEDIQRERKLKCLESPLEVTRTTTLLCNCETNEIETCNYSEIKTETNNEQSNNESLIKYEFIGNKQENDADDGMPCDFETEIAYPCQNSPRMEEKQIFKHEPAKKKNNTTVKRKNNKVSVNTIDDEPLSKLRKKVTRQTIKNKPVKNKTSKYDTQYFEEYATVTQMTPEDAKKEVELRKQSRNYKISILKCNLCYRGYGAQNTFNNHMKKHTSANGKHECEFCYLRFTKKTEYNCHILRCHKLKICCKLCPYICFNPMQAKLHIQLHKGVKYTCDLCQETFSMPNSLLSHKRIKHPTEIVCALCGSTFTSDKGLSSHHRLIHKQETNVKQGPQCVECDVHFATETAWKRHLVLSAKHTVSNGCETCGDTFGDALTLKRHVKCHGSHHSRVEAYLKPPLPAACDICNKWLTSRDFKRHMTSQHPDSDVSKRILAHEYKPYVCEFCGKRFKHPIFLETHRMKHTGEHPHKCDVCGKAFACAPYLRLHKESVHINPSGFKCDICNKTFKTKLYVTKHIKKTHLNIRAHKCDICGKAFPHPCEVKYHKQHVHGNVPWPKRDRSKRNRTKNDLTD